MIVHPRHVQLLEYVKRHPRSSVIQLQADLGVSRSTLRRDLVELEECGELVRVHGAVVHRDYLKTEPSYDRRGRDAVQEKQQIAALAAELIPHGATIYLGAGTTCVEVARCLAARSDLKIFTNSVRLLIELGGSAASFNCIGGEYRAVSQALTGGLSLRWMEHLQFDIGIAGASSLDPVHGASTTELQEAAVKQKMLQASRQTILVADHRKWSESAPVRFAGWKEISCLVTDAKPDRAVLQTLKQFPVKLIYP